MTTASTGRWRVVDDQRIERSYFDIPIRPCSLSSSHEAGFRWYVTAEHDYTESGSLRFKTLSAARKHIRDPNNRKEIKAAAVKSDALFFERQRLSGLLESLDDLARRGLIEKTLDIVPGKDTGSVSFRFPVTAYTKGLGNG